MHSAVLDDYFPIELEGVTYSETVRASSCEMLTKQQGRLANCSSRAKLALREIEKLKQKLAIALEESLSDDFGIIFAESTEEVKGSFPTGSLSGGTQ